MHSELETSNVSPITQTSQKPVGTRCASADLDRERRKSSSKERTFSDNDLRTKLSEKRKKSDDAKSQNMMNKNKNDEVDERLYGVNNGASKTQTLYGSIIEEVQKIRVRESVLLKNSVTDSTKTTQHAVLTQIEKSHTVEKNKKKIGIDDYKKRNEVKHSADDIQQEPHSTETLKLPSVGLVDKVKETSPVCPVTEKIDTLPDQPCQRIRIIEDRLVSCAKTVVKQLVKTEEKEDIEIDVESNSLPGSGQDKGSFLNDFDFSLSSEDEFVEEKSADAQSRLVNLVFVLSILKRVGFSMNENRLNGQVEQNITEER